MDTEKQVECKKNRFQNAEQVKKPNIHSFKIPNKKWGSIDDIKYVSVYLLGCSFTLFKPESFCGKLSDLNPRKIGGRFYPAILKSRLRNITH